MSEVTVQQRMREDWNTRAREDAHYYVAFGRKDQDNEEFFATGADVVRSLVKELRRFGPVANPRRLRALEIGCGPGRLLRPMSQHFGEIHGIDVADEMIARAKANLAGIPHAHAHHGTGADLNPFADESFDFVYSYAVFQHIPSREVIQSYLNEAERVLRPGGLIRVQVSGLIVEGRTPDTWQGATLTAHDLRRFAGEKQLSLLEIEGAGTQYLWATLRKPLPNESSPSGPCRIRSITSAAASERVAASDGRYAAASLWVENLPAGADLLRLDVRFRDRSGEVRFVGPASADGLVQVNALLPPQSSTGLVPVELWMDGARISDAKPLRVVPAPPLVPRVITVTDGVHLLEDHRCISGSVKVTIEEVADIAKFHGTVNGIAVRQVETLLVNPLVSRWEVNFQVPGGLPRGVCRLEMGIGSRRLAPTTLELA